MKAFNPNGLVMKMVKLVGDIHRCKKAYSRLRAENAILSERLQAKLPFEARG